MFPIGSVLDEFILHYLVSISPNKGGYVQTFNVKDGEKDKNNKLMFFRIDDDNLLDKYKTIRTKSLMIDIQKPKVMV